MNLRKKVPLLCAFIMLCLIAFYILTSEKLKMTIKLSDDNNMLLTIHSNSFEKELYPYEDPVNNIYYYFLPAYAQSNTLHINKSPWQTITINGEQITNRCQFHYETDKIYEITITDNITVPHTYQVLFMRSANIPAVYVETDSGSMDFLNTNKNNAESGQISIIEENGNLEYSGSLERISGRGNSSWAYDKKPYAIKLKDAKALLGMDQGKRWCLLPIYKEANRMQTKIAMDMAAEMGLSYTPQCTWIDLYLNGEYNGNYLLIEAIAVENGRVEINDLEKDNKAQNPSIENAPTFTEETYKGYELDNDNNINGGYLIEKELTGRYETETAGFSLSSGAKFVLKSPEHASRKQVKYIQTYFQKIEDMIIAGNPDYDNYIDLASFASRFLIDEISLNYDAAKTSMFFYKNDDSDLLYAGPIWDYDWSMGWGKENLIEGMDYDYLSLQNENNDCLFWYEMLYNNEKFYEQITATFHDLLPYMETILESTIDEYTEFIRASIMMDETRWKDSYAASLNRGNYMDFDNNVRHLKFFLANRLNFLCREWNIPHEEFSVMTTGEFHQVTFVNGDSIVETRMVPDGDMLTDLPIIDGKDISWYFTFNKLKLSDKLPIYEDCTLYAGEPEPVS